MPRRAKLKKPIEVGRHLHRHPDFYHGELTFKGTRIPVRTVLKYIAKGMTIDEALVSWPSLAREAIEEAFLLATAALEEKAERAA